MTKSVIPITPEHMHRGFGFANLALMEAPDSWQERALELLREAYGPQLGETIMGRLIGLTRFLKENPQTPFQYASPGGSVSILPALMRAAALGPLDPETLRFDGAELAKLAGTIEKTEKAARN